MKHSRVSWLFVLSSLVVVVSVTAAQRPQPEPASRSGISLTLTAVEGSVKVDSPIRMKVVMTNDSVHDIHLMKDASFGYYWVEAVDDKDHRAPLTTFGTALGAATGRVDRSLAPLVLSGSMVFVTVKAGKTWIEQLDASRFYKLSEPGKYVIHVEAPAPTLSRLCGRTRSL
jgi:hypothetical protein